MPLPTVCIVTLDGEFVEILRTELLPWARLVLRDTYEDLARWTREKHVSAVVIDIDTQGNDPLGGLPVLTELRRLNNDFTLISMSRARTRSVEKQALNAGADAYFRTPVEVSELRMTLVDTIRRRAKEAERERSRQQVLEASSFQDFIGASEPMRRIYDAIQQIASSNINVLIRGESGIARNWPRAPLSLSAAARTNLSFASIAPHSPKTLSNRSCSEARRAHLPGPVIEVWKLTSPQLPGKAKFRPKVGIPWTWISGIRRRLCAEIKR